MTLVDGVASPNSAFLATYIRNAAYFGREPGPVAAKQGLRDSGAARLGIHHRREKGAAMSVTHANGSPTDTRTELRDAADGWAATAKERSAELVEQTKATARRRPVTLATAAAGLATVVAAVVTVVRRRRAHPTPRQRAVNAWRRTSESVRKRVKR
ncbi:hypothetical protein KZZ52_50855 [Dactylosporangium sp. AC04546]|uniref:hypothetical protein n=1 Tax=Dactylosporangium sp. AC04546 TaxID=2862460 RepID=UPI001EE0F100|nr:hypothetical protein [Dactylosporangium sp. AC04546]WVK82172.1 hypothetical protein KZZ52_50855 [Dactylosporangium sp. AC04546]